MKRKTLKDLGSKHDDIDMELDWENEYGSPQEAFVSVDGEYVPVDEVKVLDIEEDIMGKDLLTFEYAGTTMKSYIVIK